MSDHPPERGGAEAPLPTERDEGWREPPGPERELDRRLRERDRRVPWVRIVVLAAALVGILVFHGAISSKVAGCYGHYVEPADGGDAQRHEPTLRIEPARKLPAAPP